MGRKMTETHFTLENFCPQKSQVTTFRVHVSLKKAGLWTVLVVLTRYICPESFPQSQRQGLTLARTLAGCHKDAEVQRSARTRRARPTKQEPPSRGRCCWCTTSRDIASHSASNEKSGRRTEIIVRKQKAISQRQMAKIGTANTSIAVSEVKTTPCSSPCTSSANARDPSVAWILPENENLTSPRQVYAKSPQSLNVTSLCPALVSGFWFSSLLLSDSHTSFLHLVWKGSSVILLHHQFSAPLTTERFPHTICTISDAMVFAKQGHRHRNTPTHTFRLSLLS